MDTLPEIETPYGVVFFQQELFCWRYALHGNGMKAYREIYNIQSQNACNVNACRHLRKDKIRHRINQLLELHNEGKIDLRAGPESVYPEAKDKILYNQPRPPHLNKVKIARVLCGESPEEVMNAK